jgi:hypothetical protein
MPDDQVSILVRLRDQFSKPLGRLNSGINRLDRKLKRDLAPTLDLVANRFTALGVAFAGFKLSQLGQDAEELANKFRVVFGDAAAGGQEFAETLSGATSRSVLELTETLAGFQDLFVPLGFARDQAAELSKTLTTLAVDVASFQNKSDADVVRDFAAALTGSSETVRKYGIVITEAALKQRALTEGLDPANLTEQQKAFLRLQLLVEGSSDALGDAARTSDSFANTVKGLRAQLVDTGAAIGAQLNQFLLPFLRALGELATFLGEWINRNREILTQVAQLGGLLVGVRAALAAATVAAKVFQLAMLRALLAVAPAIAPITLGLAGVLAVAGVLDDALAEVGSAATNLAAQIGQVFSSLASGELTVGDAIGAIVDGFKIAFRGVQIFFIEPTALNFQGLGNILIGLGKTVVLSFRTAFSFLAQLARGFTAFLLRQLEDILQASRDLAHRIDVAFGDQVDGWIRNVSRTRAGLLQANREAADDLAGAWSDAGDQLAMGAEQIGGGISQAYDISGNLAQLQAYREELIATRAEAIVARREAEAEQRADQATAAPDVRALFEQIQIPEIAPPVIEAGEAADVAAPKLDDMAGSIDGLQQSTDRLARTAEQPLAGFFESIITGSDDAQTSFAAMARSIIDNFTRMAAQQAASGAVGGLTGLAGLAFNRGGLVPGGGPDADSVPAMLTPGEFVLRRDAVNQIGADALRRLNRAGARARAPSTSARVRFNEGGSVPASSGGAPAAVGLLPVNDHQAEEIARNGLEGIFRALDTPGGRRRLKGLVS